jgi:hypothetical protein
MAVTRTRAEEYRRLAEECLATMRTVSTEEARNILLERAQFWFRLAQEQDKESAPIGGSVPPTPPAASQPAAQQQQQVQPKNDDKKK